MLLAALSFGSLVHAQGPKAGPPDRSTIMTAVKNVIEKARYAVLITNGEDGQPHARVLDAFPPEGDMTVWFGTHQNSRKVKEIGKDARVTVFYTSPELEGYVALLGKASLVNDPQEKEKRWKKEWAMFYKNANKGEDYLLIKFTPSRLEMTCYSAGLPDNQETGLPIMLDLP
jgi:general stress protein 26